jgi:hypothetical protein
MANPKLAVLEKDLGSIENGVISQGKAGSLTSWSGDSCLRRLAVLEGGHDRGKSVRVRSTAAGVLLLATGEVVRG